MKKLVPDITVYFVVYTLFFSVLECVLILKENLSLTEWLFWQLHWRFIFFGLALTVWSLTAKPLHKPQFFFSWKLWSFPSLFLIVFGLCKWQLNPTLNQETQPFFSHWQWTGVISWTLLFILQLYLYQKKGIDNIGSFTLSYYGVFLASAFYEPWLPSYFIHRVLTLIFFAGILMFFKWKPTRHTLTCALPFVLTYLCFSSLPYWSVRLIAFPLFLAIPLTLPTIEKT